MEKETAQQRIIELRALLEDYSRRYYVENAPVISDFEFDRLMRELEDLEKEFPELDKPDSPTHKVGSDLETGMEPSDNSRKQQGFIQRPHRYPMLSLGNTYSISEIEEFVARADRTLGNVGFTYSCELKFDGTAICLSYRHGRLIQALTRGDGLKGDDVTENVRQISNIPTVLRGNYPEEFEIRGEILMPYKEDKAILVNSIIGALVGVAANFVVVPVFKASGSALVSLLSEFSVLLSACHFVYKRFERVMPFVLILKNILFLLPICLVMYVISVRLSPLVSVCCSAAALVSYCWFIQCYVLHDELCLSVMSKYGRK